MADQVHTNLPPPELEGRLPSAETEPHLTQLVTGILSDAQELIKQQFALFQVELREDLRRSKEAAIAMGIGVAVLLMGAFFVAVTLAILLAELLGTNYWVGFAIVTGVLLIAGGILFAIGRNKFASFNPLPDRTVDALKENVQWLTRR